MSMTHEEAARILDPKTSAKVLREYGDGNAQITACDEACRIAADVLRNLQPDCNKLQLDCKPLTMEQLREMDGQPVLVETKAGLKFWAIVTKTCVSSGDGRYLLITEDTEYGRTWIAYAYPPAHIDREAWVSVEEKLPDAEEEVRLCCMTASGYRYQCQGFYVPPGTHRDDSGYSWDWECCEEYDEERDDYLVNPGWYESIHNWDEYSACGIVDRVIYWMPLLETPGELEKRLRG